MAAGDVAGFVRDHPDDLVWRIGDHQRARMHEHVVAVDDEGVEVLVVDKVDADVLGAEPGGAEDWLRVLPDQCFGFGIADEPARISDTWRDEAGD